MSPQVTRSKNQKQPFAHILYSIFNIQRKTPVFESLFNTVAKACNFIKKRHQHRCFPVNIVKFLRKAFFIEHLQWLLLILLDIARFLRILSGCFCWLISKLKKKIKKNIIFWTNILKFRDATKLVHFLK